MRRNSQQKDILIPGVGLLADEIANALTSEGHHLAGGVHIADYKHIYVAVKSKEVGGVVALIGKMIVRHENNKYCMGIRYSEENKLTPAEAKEYVTCPRQFLESLPINAGANLSWRGRAHHQALVVSERHSMGSLLHLKKGYDLIDTSGVQINRVILAHGHGLAVYLPTGERMEIPRNIRQEYFNVSPVIKILAGETKEDAHQNRLAVFALMKDISLSMSDRLTVYGVKYQAYKDNNRNMAFLASNDGLGGENKIHAVVGGDDLTSIINTLATKYNKKNGYDNYPTYQDNSKSYAFIDEKSLQRASDILKSNQTPKENKKEESYAPSM